MNKNVYAQAVIIGKRIKSLRAFLDLSRQEFEKNYHISANTLRSWEEPAKNKPGLTKHGALRLANALNQQGIECHSSWLIEGVGAPPQIKQQKNNLAVSMNIPQVSWVDNENVLREVHFFEKINPHALVSLIIDDGMAPIYQVGDYIGGKVKTSRFDEFIGCDCIVETMGGALLVRRIAKGTKKNHYHLCCTNVNTMIAEPVCYNVTLRFLAPIIWYRKPER